MISQPNYVMIVSEVANLINSFAYVVLCGGVGIGAYYGFSGIGEGAKGIGQGAKDFGSCFKPDYERIKSTPIESFRRNGSHALEDELSYIRRLLIEIKRNRLE